MINRALEQRLNQLRRRGHPGVAALWLEALPPGEAFDLACGYDQPWAKLVQARVLIEAGRIEEASLRLESTGELGPRLERVRRELSDRVQVGREAMSQPVENMTNGEEDSQRDAALRQWLGRVRRWKKTDDQEN